MCTVNAYSAAKRACVTCLLLVVLMSHALAFMTGTSFKQRVSLRRNNPTGYVVPSAMSPEDNSDPTKSFTAKVADSLQNILSNSPLNDAKKALVRMIAGDYDKTVVRAKLDNLIADKPVLMLSFTTCPFCLKAKSVLDEKGATYEVIELDELTDGKAIRAEMADVVGRTSVPAIWIGGEFIGGCNDGPMGGIVKLKESGKLESMLASVGALS